MTSLTSADQRQTVSVEAIDDDERPIRPIAADVDELRERWSKMTDVHQFFGCSRS